VLRRQQKLMSIAENSAARGNYLHFPKKHPVNAVQQRGVQAVAGATGFSSRPIS
jgi:hypothetical protein